ncbi:MULTISPECIES: acyl carrier protein [Streptomyces]|uniref:Acyl carrier protein n=1 Tax=Streptomyces rochei TaxID=1928 RepID=A0ABW7DTL3_STRRO|nr:MULTISPECIES: acyl carrier protein [Streptomyces]MBQ0881527.1 acyl carrier protein [Streptomyces sp. RT42]MDI3102117.1 acyl carrier protein [Streptomyces sp. AN-3]WQC10511.1 acyl carrier protein [Streptomyces rochei]
MNRTDALERVRQALSSVIPDADVADLAPQDEFREALEMDSLDFLNFVEVLSERAGVRTDDEDASRLSTLSTCADFLINRTQ